VSKGLARFRVIVRTAKDGGESLGKRTTAQGMAEATNRNDKEKNR